jgi:signal transduction histidine kinase
MRRIRLVFALLAVLLWVPIALLVRNALQSLELEREIRQQTLAERVFDELERQLQEIETREAQRPFADFDFYQRDPDRRNRSALVASPSVPFITGYFEIGPDGAFSSPRIPREREAAVARGDWVATAELDREIADLRDIALRGVQPVRETVAELAEEPIRQQPGTTRKTDSAFAKGKGSRAEKSRGQAVDSYQQAFRSLNRAAEPKLKKSRKEGGRVAASAALPMQILEEEVGWSADAESDLLDTSGMRTDERSSARYRASGALAPPRPAVATPRDVVEIDPLVGRWVDGSLVLHRAAVHRGRVYRQGLVVDVDALADWLRDEVLSGNPLQLGAQLVFTRANGDVAIPRFDYDFAYRHRFSDPFDALSATLSIPVLSDVRGAGYLYAISALLIVAGTVGLFAVYRMVSVAISFAERRNNFVAAVTHELKTPLTAIRMYGEMLRDDMVPNEEKRREYFSTITAESERLTRLINNVLEFSRLEQGTREMNLVAGAIGPVVEEAARLLEPHARDQGFSIRVELEPDLPVVRFDRDALLQVVFNLVDNALKYAREASDREITLHCTAADAGVALSVRDHGPGVSSGHLSKIFEPFYRAEPEMTRTAKGTGIGLSLVKGLAERMGAAVTGNNVSGGGFEVRLEFEPA